MNDSLDLRNLNKEPFVVNNQIYVLGNPVISTQTLEQLVYTLDQLGAEQPIVIINPQATTVPQFDQRLAQLIQNNRRTQPHNQTTDDKYKFKDMTDEDLWVVVNETCQKNPILEKDNIFEMYQGLRSRAQALFNLEQLVREQDALWAAHCANPSSTEGSERYSELHYILIPQAQKIYDDVCRRLQSLDETYVSRVQQPRNPSSVSEPTRIQQSSVSNTNVNTQISDANNAAIPEVDNKPVDSCLEDAAPNQVPNISLWGPWNSIDYMQMPLSAARNIVDSPSYTGLRAQQRDVIFEGTAYKAVEPEYLIALGIPLIPDGIPVVYTDIGTFKRVGYGTEPINNLEYWYPTPKPE